MIYGGNCQLQPAVVEQTLERMARRCAGGSGVKGQARTVSMADGRPVFKRNDASVIRDPPQRPRPVGHVHPFILMDAGRQRLDDPLG